MDRSIQPQPVSIWRILVKLAAAALMLISVSAWVQLFMLMNDPATPAYVRMDGFTAFPAILSTTCLFIPGALAWGSARSGHLQRAALALAIGGGALMFYIWSEYLQK